MPGQQTFFEGARAALREGNPYPMLSDQAEFANEHTKTQWRRRADLMLDIRASIRSRIVSIALADDIWLLLIKDREVANPTLARSFLEQLLTVAKSNDEADQAYAEFLSAIAHNENAQEIVDAERERRGKVASHVEDLLARIDTGTAAGSKSLIYKCFWPIRYLLNILTYIYLLRVPLLAAGVAAWILCGKALNGWAKMLAGAFDQSTGWQVIALTLTDVLFLYSLLVTGHVILAYSAPRETAHLPSRHADVLKFYHYLWTSFCWVTAPLLLITAYVYSSIKPRLFIGYGLIGAIIALLITTLVHVFRRAVVPRGHGKFEETFPFLLIPNSWLDFLENQLLSGLTKLPLELFSKLPNNLTRGYLAVPEDSKDGRKRLLPGHGLAVIMVIAFLAVYEIVGRLHCGTAIVYVLLLMTLLCWIFSGLAFFLDRYRISMFVSIIGYFWLAAILWEGSDHYFELCAPPPSGYYGAESPEFVLAERPRAAERPIIVVSANGGGIQSAAWTARVLAGLAEKFQETGPANLQKFLESIRLISGVSGGSVGTMFFVNEIEQPGSPREMSFKNVIKEAEDSSLEEVVWGLTYPDLAQAFFPFLRADLLLDRGRTLEETWVNIAAKYGSPSLDAGLLEWNRGVIEGWRPATIFNATFVESGERLQISTIPLGDTKGAEGRQEFFYLYNADIRVATAARLSASYLYVSPAARPLPEANSRLFEGKPKYYSDMHIVDGGYFDNSGLCALTEWLNKALTDRENVWKKANRPPIPKEQILVLEIRGFPEHAERYKSNRGWLYQSYAPLSTLLGVWTAGQLSTNVTELDLLRKYWGQKGIEIIPVIFQPDPRIYDGPKKRAIPLSWHLRDQDKQLIEQAWEFECQHKCNCQTVMEFIGQP